MINLFSTLVIALQILSVQISIDPSGVVTVTMDVTVTQGINEIQLPVQPIVESIEVTVGNRSLTPIYSNDTLYVFSPANGTAHISYLANITTSNGVLEFDIVSRALVKLVLSSNIVLLSVPTNLVNFSYIDNKLVLYLYGPQTIQYIVKIVTTTTTTIATPTRTTTTMTTTTTTATTIPTTVTTIPISATLTTTPLVTTTTTSPKTTPIASLTISSPRTTTTTPVTTTRTTMVTRTTTTLSTPLPTAILITTTTAVTTIPTTAVATSAFTSSSTTSPITSLPSPATTKTMQIGETPWLPGAVIAVAIVGAALGVLVALSRRHVGRSGSTVTEVLGDLDKAILAKLAEKGGSALQSELQKELGAPKTTLWRHIKKLEKLGYVEIVKEGTFNRIVLKRKL